VKQQELQYLGFGKLFSVSGDLMKHLLIICVLIVIFFGCKEKPEAFQVSSTEQSYNKTIENDESDRRVKSAWQQLIEASKLKNDKLFFSLSMDTIDACGRNLPVKQFIKYCSSGLFSEMLFTRIKDSSKIEVQNNEIISSYHPASFLSQLKKHDSTFVVNRVQVDLNDTEPYFIAFDFVETNDGYRFFSCSVHGDGGPQCCR